MSLETLLGLASAKAVAAVAGATLAVGGAAGIVVASEHVPDTDTTVVVEEHDAELESTQDATLQVEENGDGPDENAAQIARDIHDYITTTEDEGCAFGLGVAAIASGGAAPAADEVCDREGGGEESSNSEQGADAATAGADNAERADDAADNADEGLDEARERSGDAAVPDDVPAGPGTGEDARGDAGPPTDD